jgi:hypothetical protein
MTLFDPPLSLPPMLARGQNRIGAAFDAIDRESRRLRVRLRLVEWTLANDPDESTEAVAVMPRALDLAAGRVA